MVQSGAPPRQAGVETMERDGLPLEGIRYAVRGRDGEVSVVLGAAGVLECQECRLGEDSSAPTRFGCTAAMLEHLLGHEAAGHAVPTRVYRRLERDAARNDTWMARHP